MVIMDDDCLELFTMRCKICNSNDIKFYVASDNRLVIECDKCDELEEVETQ